MEPFIALAAGLLSLMLSIVALAAWRIRQVTTMRAMAMTARATGSFAECVSFLRYCVEEKRESRESMDVAARRDSTAPRDQTTNPGRIGHAIG